MDHSEVEKNSVGETERTGCAPLLSLQRAAWFRWLDSHFNKVMIILAAAVATFAAVVGFLETWADNHYAVAVRQGQVLAMDALRHEMSSRQRENYDFYLYTTWNEWDSRRIRANLGQDEIQAARSSLCHTTFFLLFPLWTWHTSVFWESATKAWDFWEPGPSRKRCAPGCPETG